ncbi:MAG TPA: glycosyltransferase family 87 protein [Terracidiphilus sp.]|nr:glycosyltransferase family 87 protein [Terracidiphilus sp.]
MPMDGGRIVTKQNRELDRSIVFGGRSHSALFGQHGANIVTIIVLGLCAFVYIKTNVLAPIPGLRSQSDFGVYYHAAKDVVSGTSPYENPAYFYPPLVAFLMTPFAFTDYVTARSTWFILSHLLLLWAGWLLWRAWGRGRIGLCCIAAVWAFGGAFKETLDVGQLSPLLVLSLAIAYTPHSKFQDAAVGIGFALKYIPGVLAAALILHRGWRAFLAFAGMATLAVLIPWGVLLWVFTGAKAPVSAHYWMGTPAMFSWSIPSVVLRLLSPLKHGGALPHDWEYGNVAVYLHLSPEWRWISAGTAMVILAIGLLMLALRCRGRLSGEQLPWAMVALVSLSLAAAPVCWSHYQVLQYPGVALLLAHSIRLRAWRTTAAVVLCFLLLHRLPETFLNHYHDEHSGWTAASPVTLYVWTSVTPLACLGLFGLALSHVKRDAGAIPQISGENGKGQFTSVHVDMGKSIAADRRATAPRASMSSSGHRGNPTLNTG